MYLWYIVTSSSVKMLNNVIFITHLRAKQTFIYLACNYFPFTQRTVNDVLDTNRQSVCLECNGAGAHKPKQQDWPFTGNMDGWVYF